MATGRTTPSLLSATAKEGARVEFSETELQSLQKVARHRADAALVSMDGFHLANEKLHRLDRHARKGAADTFDAAGLTVEFRRDGSWRELPAMVDLAAYRIVQESLTNAHKYGNGTVTLSVRFGPGEITLDIANPVRTSRTRNGGGYGIAGMRERASATGGTLETTLTSDGRFLVHAVLPSPVQPAAP